MDKVAFTLDDGNTVEFYVLEETRINATNYILVTEEETGDGDALILKDLSKQEDAQAEYAIVSEDEELNAVAEMFKSLLEDVEFISEK